MAWQADTAFDRGATSLVLNQVLTEWRAAERRLGATSAGSLDFAGATAEVAALRDAYHRLFIAIRTHSQKA